LLTTLENLAHSIKTTMYRLDSLLDPHLLQTRGGGENEEGDEDAHQLDVFVAILERHQVERVAMMRAANRRGHRM
jgi:hypothetical protein